MNSSHPRIPEEILGILGILRILRILGILKEFKESHNFLRNSSLDSKNPEGILGILGTPSDSRSVQTSNDRC